MKFVSVMTLFAVAALFMTVMSTALASTDGNLNLVGYVLTFDEKLVTIESGNQKWQVPRTLYPDKAKAGEMITVPLTKTEFAALAHSPLTVKK